MIGEKFFGKLFETIYHKELTEMRKLKEDVQNTVLKMDKRSRELDHTIEHQLDRVKRLIADASKDSKTLKELLCHLDISVKVQQKESSWAVISLQGETKTFVEFIPLKDKDIHEIAKFLQSYYKKAGNVTVDAIPKNKLIITENLNNEE